MKKPTKKPVEKPAERSAKKSAALTKYNNPAGCSQCTCTMYSQDHDNICECTHNSEAHTGN